MKWFAVDKMLGLHYPERRVCQPALAPAAKSVSVADAVAKVPAADLEVVTDLIAAGKIRPVLDRIYPLTEAAEAHRYVEAGHKRDGVALAVIPREQSGV